MPSRLPAGYDTTSNSGGGAGAARTPYSWAPSSQTSQPGTQPAAVSYYGYAVAPSGHLAYPTAAAAAASSSSPSPKQEFTKKSAQAEERQGSSKQAMAISKKPLCSRNKIGWGPSSSASPPSRTNSLES